MRPEADSAAPPPAASGWSRARQDLAIVLWPSFLVAAAGTMFFFAAVDPLALGDEGLATGAASRESLYAAGFFFFWLLTAAASALSLYLARTERPRPPGAPGPP